MKKFLKTLLFTTMLIVFMTGCSDLSSNTNNSGIPSIPGGGGSDTGGNGSDTGDNGQGGGDDTISAPAGTGRMFRLAALPDGAHPSEDHRLSRAHRCNGADKAGFQNLP